MKSENAHFDHVEIVFQQHLHQNPGGNRQHCPKDDVKVVDGISDLVFIRYSSVCCFDPKNIRLSLFARYNPLQTGVPTTPSSRRQIACQWHRCNSSSRLLSCSRCLAVHRMCFRCVRYKFCLDDAAGRREVQLMILSKS